MYFDYLRALASAATVPGEGVVVAILFPPTPGTVMTQLTSPLHGWIVPAGAPSPVPLQPAQPCTRRLADDPTTRLGVLGECTLVALQQPQTPYEPVKAQFLYGTTVLNGVFFPMPQQQAQHLFEDAQFANISPPPEISSHLAQLPPSKAEKLVSSSFVACLAYGTVTTRRGVGFGTSLEFPPGLPPPGIPIVRTLEARQGVFVSDAISLNDDGATRTPPLSHAGVIEKNFERTPANPKRREESERIRVSTSTSAAIPGPVLYNNEQASVATGVSKFSKDGRIVLSSLLSRLLTSIRNSTSNAGITSSHVNIGVSERSEAQPIDHLSTFSNQCSDEDAIDTGIDALCWQLTENDAKPVVFVQKVLEVNLSPPKNPSEMDFGGIDESKSSSDGNTMLQLADVFATASIATSADKTSIYPPIGHHGFLGLGLERVDVSKNVTQSIKCHGNAPSVVVLSEPGVVQLLCGKTAIGGSVNASIPSDVVQVTHFQSFTDGESLWNIEGVIGIALPPPPGLSVHAKFIPIAVFANENGRALLKLPPGLGSLEISIKSSTLKELEDDRRSWIASHPATLSDHLNVAESIEETESSPERRQQLDLTSLHGSTIKQNSSPMRSALIQNLHKSADCLDEASGICEKSNILTSICFKLDRLSLHGSFCPTSKLVPKPADTLTSIDEKALHSFTAQSTSLSFAKSLTDNFDENGIKQGDDTIIFHKNGVLQAPPDPIFPPKSATSLENGHVARQTSRALFSNHVDSAYIPGEVINQSLEPSAQTHFESESRDAPPACDHSLARKVGLCGFSEKHFSSDLPKVSILADCIVNEALCGEVPGLDSPVLPTITSCNINNQKLQGPPRGNGSGATIDEDWEFQMPIYPMSSEKAPTSVHSNMEVVEMPRVDSSDGSISDDGYSDNTVLNTNVVPPVEQPQDRATRAVVEEQGRRLQEVREQQRAQLLQIRNRRPLYQGNANVVQQAEVQRLFQQHAEAVQLLQREAHEATRRQLEEQSRQWTAQHGQVAHGQLPPAQNIQDQQAQEQGLQFQRPPHRDDLNGHLYNELLRRIQNDVEQDFLRTFRQQFLQCFALTGLEHAVHRAPHPSEIERLFSHLFNPAQLCALGPRPLHEQTAVFAAIIGRMIRKMSRFLHRNRLVNPEGATSRFPAYDPSTPHLLIQQVYASFFRNVHTLRAILFANEDDRQALRPDREQTGISTSGTAGQSSGDTEMSSGRPGTSRPSGSGTAARDASRRRPSRGSVTAVRHSPVEQAMEEGTAGTSSQTSERRSTSRRPQQQTPVEREVEEASPVDQASKVPESSSNATRQSSRSVVRGRRTEDDASGEESEESEDSTGTVLMEENNENVVGTHVALKRQRQPEGMRSAERKEEVEAKRRNVPPLVEKLSSLSIDNGSSSVPEPFPFEGTNEGPPRMMKKVSLRKMPTPANYVYRKADFKHLPDDAEKMVVSAWDRRKNKEECLSTTMDVVREDLQRIRPPQKQPKDQTVEDEKSWLSAQIINVYIALMIKCREADQNANSMAYLTIKESKIIFGKSKNRFKRVPLKREVFDKTILAVPILDEEHFKAVIVHFPTQSIHFLESVGEAGDEYMETFADYLNYWRDQLWREKMTFTMYSRRDLPRQNNDFDCGVFTLGYLDAVHRNVRPSFSQENTPEMRAQIAYALLSGKVFGFTF